MPRVLFIFLHVFILFSSLLGFPFFHTLLLVPHLCKSSSVQLGASRHLQPDELDVRSKTTPDCCFLLGMIEMTWTLLPTAIGGQAAPTWSAGGIADGGAKNAFRWCTHAEHPRLLCPLSPSTLECGDGKPRHSRNMLTYISVP